MKKSVFTFIAAIFALSLAACGTPAAEEQTDIAQAEVSETTSEQTETETTTITSAETTSETTTETVTETETETETEQISECRCATEFQHACCEYLNELNFLAGGIYYGDINGDGTPETVVETNPFESTCVLYENENGMQVLELPTVADRGHVGYIADTKQILLNPRRTSQWSSWGYEEYHIYSWNGTDYEETSSVYRKPGIYGFSDGVEYSEYGQAYIDGEEVDNDTFEIRLAEFEKLGNETDYFPVVRFLNAENEEIFESYMKENFPCFDNWDAFPVKEGSL